MLVSIPTSENAPVLNLAQAVLVLAYEVFLCQVKADSPGKELSTHAEREQMYAHLQEALIDVGFLSSSNPVPIMNTLRGILGRTGLDSREVRILRGLMRQIRWFATEGHRLDSEKVKKN
jgi:tRNA/rRNA methyltransferase